MILIAELDGEAVGTADVLIVPNLTHDGASWIQVENVVVSQRHRRTGIGRAMMGEIERKARSLRCYKIQLLSSRERAGADAFYEGLGFSTSANGYRKYLEDEWDTDPAGWVHRERHEPPSF